MTQFFKVKITYPNGEVNALSAATHGKKNPEQTCEVLNKRNPGHKYEACTETEYKEIRAK